MHFSRSLSALIVASVAFVGVAQAGLGEVCLQKDRGCIDYSSTKDCCASSAGGATHFREDLHICANDNLVSDNSLNTGAMVNCCESRGMGSRALASTGDTNDPPKCSAQKKRGITMARERDGTAAQPLNKRKGCAMTTSLGAPPTAGFGVGICQAGGGKCELSEDGSKCELNDFAKAHCVSVGCNGPL